MENLNKENFFNQMIEQYPDAMQTFSEWIDKYKESVMWEQLFNSGFARIEDYNLAPMVDPGKTKAPKFHDLPFLMQLGLIIQYGNEIHGRKPYTPDMTMQHMTTILSSQQQRINYQKEQDLKCKNND